MMDYSAKIKGRIQSLYREVELCKLVPPVMLA